MRSRKEAARHPRPCKVVNRRQALKTIAATPMLFSGLTGCVKVDFKLKVISASVYLDEQAVPYETPQDLLLVKFDMKNVSDHDLSSGYVRVIGAYQNGIRLEQSDNYRAVGLTKEDYWDGESEQFASGYSHEAYAIYRLRDRIAQVDLKSDSNDRQVQFRHSIQIA